MSQDLRAAARAQLRELAFAARPGDDATAIAYRGAAAGTGLTRGAGQVDIRRFEHAFLTIPGRNPLKGLHQEIHHHAHLRAQITTARKDSQHFNLRQVIARQQRDQPALSHVVADHEGRLPDDALTCEGCRTHGVAIIRLHTEADFYDVRFLVGVREAPLLDMRGVTVPNADVLYEIGRHLRAAV